MTADGVLCVACGGAYALFIWVVLGWKPDERRWLCSSMVRFGGAARRCAVRLYGALHQVVSRYRPKSQSSSTTLGEVSEMVDVVRLGLSSGLSFDASLELYCANRSNELADRMNQARLSWQMGLTTRGEELLQVARDLDVRPLESFAIAVSQALSLGAPLVETLASQSREIRSAHRAQVEREIERAPVKLLIPTGTLILPALLLSIVGPLLAASGML